MSRFYTDPPCAQVRLAYAVLILTTIFWGGNAVAGRLAVGHVSPMVLTALRWTVAVAILSVIAGPRLVRERKKVKAHLPLLFAYGAIGFAGFNIALYSALNHTTAINVAIWQAAIPIFIFMLNFAAFRVQASWAQAVGVVISLAGVAVVASEGSMARLMALRIGAGDALMALAALFYASYSVALRFRPDIHWSAHVLVMAIAATVISWPMALLELSGPHGIWPDGQGWLVILYAAVFPAIIAQTLYIRGVSIIGSNRGGLFVNLVPVMGTLLAILVLGERFGAHHALAMLLVGAGIWLSEKGFPGRAGRRTIPEDET